MKKKELFIAMSAILAGFVICGCSNAKSSMPADNGDTDSISIEDDADIDDPDIDDPDTDVSDGDLPNPTFSKKYIAGIEFGGKPFWYDEIYETVTATLIFTKDKTVEVYMGQSLYGENDTLMGSIPLTDQAYLSVDRAIDQEKLYTMDPGSDENMCDGFHKYIFLYDENDQLLKEVGEYEPTNKDFLEAYDTLQGAVPYEEVHELMEKQKQVMRYNDCFENIKKLTEDDLIVSEAQKIITPLDEGEMIDAIEWTDDTQKCLRVKIVNQEDYWLKKDYLFYHEDDSTVIPVALDYPSAEETDLDERYFWSDWSVFKVKMEDINSDGHEDLLISLDVEEDNLGTIYYAFIYDNGEFVYDPTLP